MTSVTHARHCCFRGTSIPALYLFISGSAIGVLYKALTFESIPDEALIGRRVSAWPFTAFRRRDREA
jgi:hypothetical protein